MRLEGSCHCGAVRFSLNARTPVPYMRCYCSICRKTAGGGGYAINLGGDAATLKVEGEADISVYRVRRAEDADAAHATASLDRMHFRRLIVRLNRKVELLDRARKDIRFQALMRVWLLFHIPISFALFAALLAHVVSVFLFW